VKKDKFLSHLSHERHAPLTVIYQFTTIVRGLPAVGQFVRASWQARKPMGVARYARWLRG